MKSNTAKVVDLAAYRARRAGQEAKVQTTEVVALAPPQSRAGAAAALFHRVWKQAREGRS